VPAGGIDAAADRGLRYVPLAARENAKTLHPWKSPRKKDARGRRTHRPANGSIRHVASLIHTAGELIQLRAKLDYEVIGHGIRTPFLARPLGFIRLIIINPVSMRQLLLCSLTGTNFRLHIPRPSDHCC
jgi:hypothetical protein